MRFTVTVVIAGQKSEAWGRRTVIHLVPPRIWKRKSSYDLLQVRLGLLHSIGLT